jgi:hypothetical protein
LEVRATGPNASEVKFTTVESASAAPKKGSVTDPNSGVGSPEKIPEWFVLVTRSPIVVLFRFAGIIPPVGVPLPSKPWMSALAGAGPSRIMSAARALQIRQKNTLMAIPSRGDCSTV